MRLKGTAKEFEARRKVAARMFELSKSLREAAEACGVSLTAVKLRKRAWKAGGVEAMAPSLIWASSHGCLAPI